MTHNDASTANESCEASGQVEIPTNFSTSRWVRWILSPNGLVGSFTSMTPWVKFGGSLDSVHFCWFPILKRWQICGMFQSFGGFWKCSIIFFEWEGLMDHTSETLSRYETRWQKYGKNHWDVPWTGLTTNRAPPCSVQQAKTNVIPKLNSHSKKNNKYFKTPATSSSHNFHPSQHSCQVNSPTRWSTKTATNPPTIHPPNHHHPVVTNQPIHPSTPSQTLPRRDGAVVPGLSLWSFPRLQPCPPRGCGWMVGGWWMGGSTKDGCGLAFLNQKNQP